MLCAMRRRGGMRYPGEPMDTRTLNVAQCGERIMLYSSWIGLCVHISFRARPKDSGSQKLQRESEKLYFHTSVTFERPCDDVFVYLLKLNGNQSGAWGPAPVPNPMSFQRYAWPMELQS